MRKIKVLFLDQRAIIRQSLCSLYKDDKEIEIVTQFGKITDWPEIIQTIQPEMLILDVGYHGKEIVKTVRQKCKDVVILAITNDPSEKEFLEFFKLGIKAYLLIEDLSIEGLRAVIKFATKETMILTRPFSNILYKNFDIKNVHVSCPVNKTANGSDQSSKLSTHERAVLALTVSGANNNEISKLLNISENTTKVHLRNIMRKLGVYGKQKLASFARTHHNLRNDLILEYNHLKDQSTV